MKRNRGITYLLLGIATVALSFATGCEPQPEEPQPQQQPQPQQPEQQPATPPNP